MAMIDPLNEQTPGEDIQWTELQQVGNHGDGVGVFVAVLTSLITNHGM